MSERMSCQLQGIFRGRQQEEDTAGYIYNACMCLKNSSSSQMDVIPFFFLRSRRYVMAVQVQVQVLYVLTPVLKIGSLLFQGRYGTL